MHGFLVLRFRPKVHQLHGTQFLNVDYIDIGDTAKKCSRSA